MNNTGNINQFIVWHSHFHFTLMPKTVDIWHIDLSHQAIEQTLCNAVLSKQEQVRFAQFASPVLAHQYSQTRYILRLLLARYLAVQPANLNIAQAKQGKPYLSDYPDLHFNLSHSGTQLLIAVSAIPVGIDVELIKPRSTLNNLVTRCFALSEQHYWFSLSEIEKTPQFYAFWTRKEAFVKATGLGIVLGLADCEIDVDSPNRFVSVPAVCGSATEWRMRDLMINTLCCAAVVAKTEEFIVNQQCLSSALNTFLLK